MDKIKELKALVSFIVKIANDTGIALSDGKLTLSDVGLFVPVLFDLPSVVMGIGAVPSEILHLDSAEMSELIAQVQAELSLPQAKADAAIKGGIDIALKIFALVQSLKA